MTVQERQQRRNQFGEQPAAPPTLAYDPVADIPNADGTVTQPQPAIAPPPAPKPIVMETGEQAYRTSKLLKRVSPDQLEPGKHRELTNAVLAFNRANPGVLASYERDSIHAQWKQENLDTTPHPNSRLTAAQRNAKAKRARLSYGREGVGPRNAESMVRFPTKVTDLPRPESGSRAEYLDKREADGLDTTSGLATFGQEFDLARKVNSADLQFGIGVISLPDQLWLEKTFASDGTGRLDP